MEFSKVEISSKLPGEREKDKFKNFKYAGTRSRMAMDIESVNNVTISSKRLAMKNK